jgi:large subunit ribosomal protein L9
MKIVLKRDIKNLGKVGDICDVASGYGRNFLLQKGYAVIANKANLQKLQEKLKDLQKENETMTEKAKEIAGLLSNEVFNLVRQASDDDIIFGSVRTKDVYALINSFLSKNGKTFSFDIGGIEIQPIKTLGKYLIPVCLFGDVNVNLRINICRIASDFESDVVSFDKKFEESMTKVDDTKKNSKLASADKKIEKIAAKEQKKQERKNARQSKTANKGDNGEIVAETENNIPANSVEENKQETVE